MADPPGVGDQGWNEVCEYPGGSAAMIAIKNVLVATDEGITGIGEATYSHKEFVVAEMVRALRDRVTELLGLDGRVRTFHMGAWNEGGAGVTVAEIA